MSNKVLNLNSCLPGLLIITIGGVIPLVFNLDIRLVTTELVVQSGQLAQIAAAAFVDIFCVSAISAGVVVGFRPIYAEKNMRSFGKAMTIISVTALLISYISLLSLLVLVLAPINPGALILGVGLALIIGFSLRRPIIRLYLKTYRSF